jgi:alcohol dehydrogenase
VTASQTVVKTGMGQLAMAELPIAAPGPDQAVIRTTLSTICGSDVHILDEFPMPPGVPALPMGHEACGVVETVGTNVTAFAPGDRVVAACLFCCGRCENCMRGLEASCITYRSPGNLLFGAQGQYFTVNGAQTSLAKIPDGLADEQVLFASDIMSTGFAAVENGGVAFGDTVAHGGGAAARRGADHHGRRDPRAAGGLAHARRRRRGRAGRIRDRDHAAHRRAWRGCGDRGAGHADDV